MILQNNGSIKIKTAMFDVIEMFDDDTNSLHHLLLISIHNYYEYQEHLVM